jgi:hypothetical protein
MYDSNKRLKGQCHEIFCFWFFSWISFPRAPDDTISPLPSGTLATFFLTAIGQIKHTEEGDISREKDNSDDVTAAREGRRR